MVELLDVVDDDFVNMSTIIVADRHPVNSLVGDGPIIFANMHGGPGGHVVDRDRWA